MKDFGLGLLAIAFIIAVGPHAHAATRYSIRAVAVRVNCGDTTPVPLETTGGGYATKAACEKNKRIFIAVGRKNHLAVKASCVPL